MASISSSFLQRALTLRHLRLLIALEDMRHVGRVATALNISQPAVSKSLAEIESGVGVRLFDRTPRGMLPTDHGACLLRYAHAMTNELSRAVDELAGIEQGMAAAVAVGATVGAGTGYLLNAAILQGRDRLPGMTVTVSEGTRELLLRQLRTDRLDLVIGAVGDAPSLTDLDCTPLYIDSLAIVCGTRHPLATRRRLALPEVLSQDWVLPPRTARVRANFDALLRSTDAARPRVVAETLSLDLILELLSQSAALALLPQHLARRLGMAGQLRTLEVETPGLVMAVSVFTRADQPASAAVQTFKACLVEAAALR